MDFNKLKEKALKFKDDASLKIVEMKDKALIMKDNVINKANNTKTKALDIKKDTTDKASKIKWKVNSTKKKALDIKKDANEKANEIKWKVNNAKKKALDIKKETDEKKDDAIKYGKEKMYTFKIYINSKEEMDFIINKSKTTKLTNKETWEEKIFKHKSIVIFVEEWSDFLKKIYYIIPIIKTKAFSQNISVRLSKWKIEWIDLSHYNVDESNLPCLVVFEEEKFFKKIEWEENILKLVKSFNLDINKQIEEA